MKAPAVAVIAHRKKTLDGGLDQLRKAIADYDVADVLWYEVPKSKKAPKQVGGPSTTAPSCIFVWGGDGMVQRCVDTLAGSDVPLAIVPAGTANLLATNLGIPRTSRRPSHRAARAPPPARSGRVNGEHFAVMAGAGFDALMIREADVGLKDRSGGWRTCWTGARTWRSAAYRD